MQLILKNFKIKVTYYLINRVEKKTPFYFELDLKRNNFLIWLSKMIFELMKKEWFTKVTLVIIISLFFAHLSPGGLNLVQKWDSWFLLRLIVTIIDISFFLFSLIYFNKMLNRKKYGKIYLFLFPVILALVITCFSEIILRTLFLNEPIDALFFNFFLPILALFAVSLNGYFVLFNAKMVQVSISKEQGEKDNENVYQLHFHCTKGKQILQINENNVAYFFIENGIVYLMTLSSERLVINDTISSIETKCNPKLFFRVNRQCITSRFAIDHFSRLTNRKIDLVLKPTEYNQLISKAKVALFKKWFHDISIP
ncbi:MAG: hypothetical protein ACI8ZM_001749 [Crocinitomix sp.]